MPIEFRCPSCSKLLRTPDESAGKKAKCPQCGGIADVPLASSAPATPGVSEPLAPVPPVPSPFAGGVPEKPYSGFAEASSANPYASPALVSSTAAAQYARGELKPTSISFDRVFESAWAIFRPRMGQMAILGLVVFALVIGLVIVGQAASFGIEKLKEPTITYAFTAVNQLFGMAVQAWIGVGFAIYMLKVVRNEAPSINDLGRVGPYFVRAILLQLLVALVTYSIIAVCMAPAGVLYFVNRQMMNAIIAAIIGGVVAVGPVMYFSYRWLLAMYFIVDCNLGVMESLSRSATFMAGNKLTAFLIFIVMTIVGIFFCFFTCGFGYVLFVPYIGLITTIIYLSATGQYLAAANASRVQ